MYIYIYICIYIHIYTKVQKVISHTQKEETEVNIFIMSTYYYFKVKANLDFCRNFCAGKTHTKLRCVWQIKNLDETYNLSILDPFKLVR